MKKKTAFNDFLRQFNIYPNQVLYMGDDVPDLPVMELAGVSTCPSDSVTDVKQFADYVSHKKGGDGCVREIIEQVLRVQGKWDFGVKNKY
jgi:3-deoxy-D-manno-octulosonate 8-phosphate phosphatase (KDO 8-P phosphatase)